MPRVPRLNLLKTLRGDERDYVLLAKGNVPYYVAKVKQNAKAREFIELLKSDRAIRRVFLHHWKQLSCLEQASLPLLFGTDSTEEEEQLIAQTSRTKEQEATFTLERLFDEARPAIDQALKKFEARLGPILSSEGGADQEKVLVGFLRTMGFLSGGNPLAGLFKLAKPFEDYFADEIPFTALLFLEASKSKVLNYGMSRRKAIIRDSELTPDDYERSLKRLFDAGLLSPIGSLLWCRRHEHAPSSYYAVGHQTYSLNVRCDTCNRKLARGTFYVLNPASMMIVRQYEGALPYVLGWDLERQGYRWNSHVYLTGEADPEKDLVFLQKAKGRPKGSVGIIECKTYRTDTSERIVEENLRRDLIQLENQVESYAIRGIPVGVALFVCNYEVTERRKRFVEGELSRPNRFPRLSKVRFRVLGIEDLSEWWASPRPAKD